MAKRVLCSDVGIEDTINLLARNLKYEFNEQSGYFFYLTNGHIYVSAEPLLFYEERHPLAPVSLPDDAETVIQFEDMHKNPKGDDSGIFCMEGWKVYKKIQELFPKPHTIFDERGSLVEPLPEVTERYNKYLLAGAL